MKTNKVYQSVVEACTIDANITTIRNIFNKVFIVTGDAALKQRLKPVIGIIDKAREAGKSVPKKTRIDVAREPFKSLYDYSQKCLRSQKPQWQIIAEQHGWEPK